MEWHRVIRQQCNVSFYFLRALLISTILIIWHLITFCAGGTMMNSRNWVHGTLNHWKTAVRWT